MTDNETGFADEELRELRRRGIGFHYYGRDTTCLTELAAIFRWREVVDVAIIRGRGPDDAIAYRVPVTCDVFDPPIVIDYYISNAVWALRWIMTLDSPMPLSESCALRAMPPGRGIPQDRRRPVTVRAPIQGSPAH